MPQKTGGNKDGDLVGAEGSVKHTRMFMRFLQSDQRRGEPSKIFIAPQDILEYQGTENGYRKGVVTTLYKFRIKASRDLELDTVIYLDLMGFEQMKFLEFFPDSGKPRSRSKEK